MRARPLALLAACLALPLATPLRAAAPESVAAPPRGALPPAEPTPRADLPGVARALAVADVDAALARATPLAGSADPRTAAAAGLVAGYLHREAARWSDAAGAFAAAARHGGPLEPWAAWHEAEARFEAGEVDAAARVCAAYRTRWPDGRHADDCAELLPFAQARALAAVPMTEPGRARQVAAVRAAAAAWDARHPHEPIGEQVELELARARAAVDPAGAVPELVALATRFTVPTVGRGAELALARLRAAGHADAALPTTSAERIARAESLRASRRVDDAWAAFWSLASEAAHDPDDTALAAWVEDATPRFATDARRWPVLVGWWRARAADAPDDPAVTYELFRALERAGDYAAAFTLGEASLARWGDGGLWVEAQERVARDGLLARRYRDTVPILDGLAEVRGATGERNRFYAAFAAHLAGDDDARARLDRGAAEGGLVTEHRYWRAQHLDPIDPAAAAADRAWILQADPGSWYAALLRSDGCGDVPDERRGVFPAAPTGAPEARVWPGLAPSTALPWPAPYGELPPSRFHDPVRAAARFDALVERLGPTFPELLAVRDLVAAGLVERSGPLFAEVADALRAASKRGERPARDVVRALTTEDWRDLYLHTHDHADLTRVAWGLSAQVGDDPVERLAVDALALPLAHGRQVWRHAATHGVDPLLVLGLMRTESMFDAGAVSPVGARGPMQIMPRTGHLLADLGGEVGFHPGRLHDPDTAIAYGVRYLGLLLDRFDGAWPLAVAAYNGGPHNVSAWRAALGPDVPMDVFVEHIPWKETRRYVRTVTERYADYLAIYAQDEHLHVPASLGADDPTVVDF